MATLQIRLQDLATRIATECKSIRTLINGNAADLSGLSTTAKANLVAAINELKTTIDSVAASGGATINDTATESTAQVWSISKIVQELNDTAADVKAEILGGAGPAYDTLQELKDLLDGEAAEITDLVTAVGNRVRFDVNNQGLTTQQQTNARTNIGAVGTSEIGNPDTNFVTTFETGLS